MPSQPQTFPCPFCGRRMGAAAESAGRRVRCPHCKQVVLAPPAAEAAAPPPPPAAGPVFNLPPKEAPDSILSDPSESEDDLFGSQEGGRVPVLPPADVTPDDPLPAAPPAAQSPPLILPPPDRATADASGNPFAFEATPPPALTRTPPAPRQPPAPPAPAPAPRPRPAPPPPAEDEPVAADELPDEDEPPAREPRAARPAKARGGVPAAAVYGLAGYALLVTGLAVYGLFLKPAELPPGHPLSTIPDTYGEFDPAARKGEKGKTSANRVRGDGDLPAELRAGLGEKVEVGDVQVEPLAVERRHLHLFADGKGKVAAPGQALVLRLRVKNTSPDLTFCPLDPAFNRRTVNPAADRPLTRLVVGTDTFYGGPLAWPFPAGRQFEQEQERDAAPLGPGEAREYVVCAAPEPRVTAAVRAAKGPVLWRVQVRRGVVPFRDREVPVTAVVGVEFRKEDVAGL